MLSQTALRQRSEIGGDKHNQESRDNDAQQTISAPSCYVHITVRGGRPQYGSRHDMRDEQHLDPEPDLVRIPVLWTAQEVIKPGAYDQRENSE